MARQPLVTLTEELEKLEQSITLTLQEIDYNFSWAHRIVTSSILPIVEQYADHSRQVWDGSKFWKQFFESSANVSLSGYEEQPSTQQNVDDTVAEDSATATQTTLEGSESYATPSSASYSIQPDESDEPDVDLSSLTISPSHSTPRPAAKGRRYTDHEQPNQDEPPSAFADYPSPYEALRREVNQRGSADQPQAQPAPSTPRATSITTSRKHNTAATPDSAKSTPFLPGRDGPTSIPRPSTTRKRTDPLLHRVLDRNYRVQATPIAYPRHGGFRSSNTAAGAGDAAGPTTPITAARAQLRESTLSSSPDIPEPPQLHPDIFYSPVRKPRIPGVSVLTPRHPNEASKRNAPTSSSNVGPMGGLNSDEDDFDVDDDDAGLPFGQSPPKTMQFHIPQSRLLKTPAREASKRIVEDLLQSARVGRGAVGDGDEEDTTDDFTHFGGRGGPNGSFSMMQGEETSPNIIRTGAPFEDESF